MMTFVYNETVYSRKSVFQLYRPLVEEYRNRNFSIIMKLLLSNLKKKGQKNRQMILNVMS